MVLLPYTFISFTVATVTFIPLQRVPLPTPPFTANLITVIHSIGFQSNIKVSRLMSSQDFISELIDLKFDSFLNWSHHHNHFTALFPGPPGWAGARKELLDFMVQGEINRGRHTDHPAGRHSIRTNQCPPPPSSHIFCGSDAIPAAQPTVSKHWRHFWTGASGGELLS